MQPSISRSITLERHDVHLQSKNNLIRVADFFVYQGRIRWWQFYTWDFTEGEGNGLLAENVAQVSSNHNEYSKFYLENESSRVSFSFIQFLTFCRNLSYYFKAEQKYLGIYAWCFFSCISAMGRDNLKYFWCLVSGINVPIITWVWNLSLHVVIVFVLAVLKYTEIAICQFLCSSWFPKMTLKLWYFVNLPVHFWEIYPW